MRSYPCTDGGRHSVEPVTLLDGTPVDRWVCPVCLMRVRPNGNPMLDDGTPVPWLPLTTYRVR